MLADSSAHEFQIGAVSAPVHRIYWIDNPPLDRAQRAALTRAFDEAAQYDAAARAVLRPPLSPARVALRR
jgi:hypothetical protein